MAKLTFNQADMVSSVAAFGKVLHGSHWAFLTAAGLVIAAADKVKVAEAEIFTAMNVAGLSEGSATNYLSKCRVIAKYLPDYSVNDGETFNELAERLAPQVAALWGNDIKAVRKGGPSAPKVVRGSGKAEATPLETLTEASTKASGDDITAFIVASLPKLGEASLTAILQAVMDEQAARMDADAKAADAAWVAFEAEGERKAA